MPVTKAEQLIEQLGVHIDPELLDLALTHRSYAYENGQIPNNERLEFLGDAVLGVVVTEYLYTQFPDFPEGRLAKMRAAVVSSVSLAEVAREYELGGLIKLGKGELSTHGPDKSSILADTVEAIIGATFLTDAEAGRRLVATVFCPLVDEAARLGPGLDWKTSLQEASSAQGLGVPTYQVTSDGPAHARTFTAWVTLGDVAYPSAVGTSRKHAEQQAAQLAFEAISEDHA
ncbi:MAG: ribonuclease III [Propionibacteriaceae bacterium]|jgi:ribonuclease-3|nr:ribonuclease III [Propionibacteriaceae bacterium]